MRVLLRACGVLFIVFCVRAFSQSSKYVGLFEEWDAYESASRPENIRVDRFDSDVVWVTLPKAHGIARFEYKTKTFKYYIAGDPHRPDGLVIDSRGHLWFGQQSSGALGEFDPKADKIIHHPVPYKKANPAITALCKKEHVWISDHANNKLLEFDPTTGQFTAIDMPVDESWVVDPKADSKNRIWYSAHYTKRIGVVNEERNQITEYQSPSQTGLAFIALDGDENIWYTSWTGNQIGYLNPNKQEFVEYAFPEKYGFPQPGAITCDLVNDRVVISAKQMNAIIILNRKDDSVFHAFPIPTPESGQREGITTDHQGVIWFTEFGKNKIARLQIFDAFQMHLNVTHAHSQKSYTISSRKTVHPLTDKDSKRYSIRPYTL